MIKYGKLSVFFGRKQHKHLIISNIDKKIINKITLKIKDYATKK